MNALSSIPEMNTTTSRARLSIRSGLHMQPPQMDILGCSIPIEDRQDTGTARKYKASVRPWDIRSADESSRLQRPSEDRDQFLFHFQARRHQSQQGNPPVSPYNPT